MTLRHPHDGQALANILLEQIPAGKARDATLRIAAFIDDRDHEVEDEVNRNCPPGLICDWPNATAPGGWLKCDGATVSRTTYARLFAVTSTTFGAGDGSTTFVLPTIAGDHASTIKIVRF